MKAKTLTARLRKLIAEAQESGLDVVTIGASFSDAFGEDYEILERVVGHSLASRGYLWQFQSPISNYPWRSSGDSGYGWEGISGEVTVLWGDGREETFPSWREAVEPVVDDSIVWMLDEVTDIMEGYWPVLYFDDDKQRWEIDGS